MKYDIVFKLSDLDSYAIIEEPCTVLVKNNSTLTMDSIYRGDDYPRWLLNLKAISADSLSLLKNLPDYTYTYSEIGHLLMTGALWESQINNAYELPSKGEQMICVFDYVDDVLRCTNITLIPRRDPKLYIHGAAVAEEIEALELIIKNLYGNEE
jgi:hypothetical protein